MNNYSEENAQRIIKFFQAQGLTDFAIAGLLSNLDCESSMISNNMQNGYEKKYSINDAEYTTRVDNNTWSVPAGFPNAGADFDTDKVGYGLCQWTSAGRKTGLHNFIKSLGVSIGDMDGQMKWIMEEFHNSYKKVFKALMECTSAYDAGVLLVTKYEIPGSVINPDTKEKTQKTRGDHAEELYAKYFKGDDKVAYTNSPLVSYTLISPNRTSPRNHVIDTITIHCVVGQVTVERLGKIFQPTSKNASSNYGIGYDGRIGMYVEEKDRSWCSSNKDNDHRAITIEVASDSTAPYAVTDAAYKALVQLVADICKRNNIKELKWKGDKSLIGQVDKQNMTVHRWFAKKSCPGDYLFNRHSQIANEVNKILNGQEPTPTPVTVIKHTVAKGETLSKIAARYDTTVDAICKLNPIITNPNKISVGWVLDIPAKASDIPSTYTVVKGDTLSKIAKKVGHGCKWQDIAKVNDIKAPYIIREGQVLKLPELN